MKRFTFFFVLLTFLSTGLNGQSENSIRKLSSGKEPASLSGSCNTMQSIRLENGKVWINGNLAKPSDLPPSLRNIDSSTRFQASFFGFNDLKITLLGNEYLLKQGRIMEIPGPNPDIENPASLVRTYDPSTKEEFYSWYKQESPTMFHNLHREAALYEKCMMLYLEYQDASPQSQEIIKKEMRKVLAQWFDLNMYNMEQEVKQVEAEIDAAKKDIEYRKANKTPIVEGKLEEMLNR